MSYTELKTYWQENNAKLIAKLPENYKSGLSFNVVVDKEDIVKFCAKLLEEKWFLEAVAGADFLEGFLVTYTFASISVSGRISYRVLLKDKTSPKIPSIYSVYQGAEWHERETFDFYGIVFENNPNLIPLLLDQNHQGLPPLLKNEKDLASLKSVDFFAGELEIFDDFWKNLKPVPEVKVTEEETTKG